MTAILIIVTCTYYWGSLEDYYTVTVILFSAVSVQMENVGFFLQSNSKNQSTDALFHALVN